MTRFVRDTIGVVVLVFAIGVWTSAGAQADSDAIRTSARVEPRSVTIGTPFRYTVTFDVKSGVELALPVPSESIGPFSILDFGDVAASVDAATGRVVYERWYDLVAYETGDDLVPGAPVGWRGTDGELRTTYLPDTPISVESVLPTAADSSRPVPIEDLDLRDIKAPVEPPPAPWPILWLAVGALAGLSIGTFLYRAWARGRVPAVAAPTADETALDRLRTLRDGALFRESRLEEFYVELTNIVRTYLEARFALRAPEMTTEEFLQAAHDGGALNGEERGFLQVFLCEADLVKFARSRPSRDDAERAWSAADGFVRATAPHPEESDAAA